MIIFDGGISYIDQHANDLLTNIMPSQLTPISLAQIFHLSFSFSSIGFIELGLLLLVATQIIRVFLLVCFYAAIKDYHFLLINAYLTIMLILGFFR